MEPSSVVRFRIVDGIAMFCGADLWMSLDEGVVVWLCQDPTMRAP